MNKKIISSLLVFASALSLTSCLGSGGGGGGARVADREIDIEAAAQQYEGTLDFRFASSNGNEPISYNQATPLELPTGRVLAKGQQNLLPVWDSVGKTLGINIVDKASIGSKPNQILERDYAQNFVAGHVYGGNGTADLLFEYGQRGGFINLSKHLDDPAMKDVKDYLDAHPSIKNEITAADGNIYHLPYVAEIDNYARMFHMRGEWVEKLLDNPSAVYDTEKTITLKYEPFYDNSAENRTMKGKTVSPKTGVSIVKPQENVIEKQFLVASGLEEKKINGNQACKSLINYINDNYSYDKPSQLYLGDKASYDADELVALLRCVKTNPTLLRNKPSEDVVVYFERKGSDRANIFHLLQFFGIRSFGSDTYQGRWIFDEDGNLKHAWIQDEFLGGVEILHSLFAEGLINSEYDSNDDSEDFRETFFSRAVQNGFMTNDFPQSTILYTETYNGVEYNKGVQAVLPAVSYTNGELGYFIENTRGVKPDGWAIAASAPDGAVAQALKMFNYFYTEEGRILQNYGPQGVTWDEKEEFNGRQVPKFNDWTQENCQPDISSFLREKIGAQLAIGYQKEIEFELQINDEQTNLAWDLYNNSTIKSLSYTATDPLYRVGPAMISIDINSINIMKTVTVTQMFDADGDFYVAVRHGFGGDTSMPGGWRSKEAFIEKMKARGLDTFISIYTTAFNNKSS